MNLKTLFLTFSALPMLGFGLPSGANVEKGNASFHNPGSSHLEVSSSGANVINWDTFSIDEHETLKFIQLKGEAVLNRVTGHESGLQMSRIMGTLASEGSIYIVNPEGVLIGSNALIDVASFVATTLDISSEDFINLQKGKNQKGGLKSIVLSGDSKAKVLNLGTIKASSGDVHMIAYQVENAGNIEAKNGAATLFAGNEALLQPAAKRKVLIRTKLKASENSDHEEEGVKNSGVIEALEVDLGADGSLYKLAINHSGHIEAKTLSKEGGKIYLTAKKGSIEVDGSITAKRSIGNKESGGDVRILAERIAIEKNTKIDVSGKHGGGVALVGSDTRGVGTPFNAEHTTVSEGAFVNASALENGNGGKVVFWGQDLVNYYGTTLAEGGTEGGDGGFVEVSSLGKGFNKFIYTGFVSTLAPKGEVGTLLWDPITLEIRGGSGTDSNATESSGSYSFPDSSAAATIYVDNLSTVLGSTNVSIDVLENGTITFTQSGLSDTPMNLYSGDDSRTLTLEATGASGGVYFDQGVTGTNLNYSITAPRVRVGNSSNTNEVTVFGQNLNITLNQDSGSFELNAYNSNSYVFMAGPVTVSEANGVSGCDVILDGSNGSAAIWLQSDGASSIKVTGDVTLTQRSSGEVTSIFNSSASENQGTLDIGTSADPVANITLQALAEDATVYIGEASNADQQNFTRLGIYASEDITLSSHSGSSSYVSIGSYEAPLTLNAGGDVQLTNRGGTVQINSQVNDASTPGNATVGITGDLTMTNTASGSSTLLKVGQENISLATNNITLTDSGSATALEIDLTGSQENAIGMYCSGSISLAGGAINLNSGGSSTGAVIASLGSGDLTLSDASIYSDTSLQVQVGRDLQLSNGSYIKSAGNNKDLFIYAQRDVIVNDTSYLEASDQGSTGRLMVVTDAANSTSPDVGVGNLHMSSQARLISADNSGKIYVFAGYQENNYADIDDNAKFNGTAFSAIKGVLDTEDRHNKFGIYSGAQDLSALSYSSPATFYYKALSPSSLITEGVTDAAREIALAAASSLEISILSGSTLLDRIEEGYGMPVGNFYGFYARMSKLKRLERKPNKRPKKEQQEHAPQSENQG